MITLRKTNSLQNALLTAQLHDPFAYLGLHKEHGQSLVRVFRPYDANVWIKTAIGFEPMKRIHPHGVFEWHGESPPDMPYRLRVEEKEAKHTVYETYDSYAFPLQIPDYDLYLFNEGKLRRLTKCSARSMSGMPVSTACVFRYGRPTPDVSA